MVLSECHPLESHVTPVAERLYPARRCMTVHVPSLPERCDPISDDYYDRASRKHQRNDHRIGIRHGGICRMTCFFPAIASISMDSLAYWSP